MPNKTFNTRISLKVDTHENWIANDPILLNGEAAISLVSVAQAGQVNTPPATLIKIGDGTHRYSELSYLSALSADTYSWARQATKPSYNAGEIGGMNTFVEGFIRDEMGIGPDTNTQYTINKVNDYQYKLMSKNKGDAQFLTEIATIDIPTDSAAVTALQSAMTVLNGTGEGSVTKTVDDALNEFATTISNDGIVNTYKELVDYAATNGAQITTLVGKVTTLESEMDTAQSDIDSLELAVGGKAAQSDLTALGGRVTTAEGDITALETKVGNSSVLSQISTAINGLADIADTGNVNDLSQTAGDLMILNCGSSTVNV